MTLTEARERIGVCKETMRTWVKEGRFTIYSNPRDGRQKLVDEAEVGRYLQPKKLIEAKR